MGGQVNAAVADALADPGSVPDLFPGFDLTLAAEKAFELRNQTRPPPATAFKEEKEFRDFDVMEKVKELSPQGFQNFLLAGPGGATVTAPVQQPPPETVVEQAPAIPTPAPA